MKKLRLFPVCFIVWFSGCSSLAPANSDQNNLVGSDSDAHGCIASAGYSWCERTNQCERPWELAALEGFNNTEEAYNNYCND